jgi:hypothetical protein
MKASALCPILLAGVAAASPTATLDKRATTICGQWDSVATGAYTVYQDLWGMSAGKGSQCTTVTGIASNKLIWSTICECLGTSKPQQTLTFCPDVPQGPGPAAPQASSPTPTSS